MFWKFKMNKMTLLMKCNADLCCMAGSKKIPEMLRAEAEGPRSPEAEGPRSPVRKREPNT
jgi:hypothetical protein